MIMELTGSEKLIFIASFMWLMHWGVRIAQTLLNYVIS